LESDVGDWEHSVANGDTSIDKPTLGYAEMVLGHYYLTQTSPNKSSLENKALSLKADSLLQKAATLHGEPRGYLYLAKMAWDDHNYSDAESFFKNGSLAGNEQCKQDLEGLYLLLGGQAKKAGDLSSARSYFEKGKSEGSDACKKELDDLNK